MIQWRHVGQLEELIAELGQNLPSAKWIEKARKQFASEPFDLQRSLVSIAITSAQKAGRKSDKPWLFTQDTYEQASSVDLAAHHASRFKASDHILEVCTGSGLDTLALATHCASVTTIESNPLVASIAELNLARYGIDNVTVRCSAAEDTDVQSIDYTALWSDPARRQTGRRNLNPSASDYLPSLHWLRAAIGARRAGIKTSPLFKPDGQLLSAGTEFIGHDAECKEQLLWFNLSAPVPLVSLPAEGLSWTPTKLPQSGPLRHRMPQPGDYLVEPHSALIRSGELTEFFRERDLALIHPQIAYALSATAPEPSHWYAVFRVVEVLESDLRLIQERINCHGYGRNLEIKKRGVELNPDTVRKKIKVAPEGRAGVLIFTRSPEEHIAILAERVSV